MAVNRPFRRTCRAFTDGKYSEGGKSNYIEHPRYATSARNYIRGFSLLLKDFENLLDYIEPSDTNLSCYSYRILELLLRACIEVEANCKGIMSDNGYSRSGDWNMGDYRKINATHRLSSYQVKLPFWSGSHSTLSPFLPWASGGALSWYQAYNAAKHNRHDAFTQATFKHLVDAVCGVQVLLSAQLYTHDLTASVWVLGAGGPHDGMESGIGGYMRVKFPDDWPTADRYDFDWQKLKTMPDPFDQIDYSKIA